MRRETLQKQEKKKCWSKGQKKAYLMAPDNKKKEKKKKKKKKTKNRGRLACRPFEEKGLSYQRHGNSLLGTQIRHQRILFTSTRKTWEEQKRKGPC